MLLRLFIFYPIARRDSCHSRQDIRTGRFEKRVPGVETVDFLYTELPIYVTLLAYFCVVLSKQCETQFSGKLLSVLDACFMPFLALRIIILLMTSSSFRSLFVRYV